MRRMGSHLVLAALAGVLACSETSHPSSDRSQTSTAQSMATAPTTCTMHFTDGPIPDPNLSCTVEADFNPSTSTAILEIGAMSGDLQARFNMTKPGQLDTTTVTNTSAGATGLFILDNGNADYELTTAKGSEAGTFTFHATKVSVASTSAEGTTYSISGALDASVPADTTTSARGTVKVHVTFGGS
jgi:hypothetical protein